MQRRDMSKAFFASAAGLALLNGRAEAQTCNAPCYARTPEEVAATVTPANYAYPPGDVRRYAASVGVGGNDTNAFTLAASTGHNISVPPGTYLVDGGALTLSTNGQTLIGSGRGCTFIRKRSNGNLLTIAASYVTVEDIEISNDLASSYTGYNIWGTGTRTGVVLHRVNSFRSLSQCVNYEQFGHFTIRNCYMDNAPAPAGTPVVTIGQSGLGAYASLYGVIDGCQLQPSGNPVRFDAVGCARIVNSQIGGFENNTAGGVTNGQSIMACRITGPVNIEGHSHSFTGNQIGAYTVTFESGSTGNWWIGNTRSAGSTMINSGSTSNVIIEIDSATGFAVFNEQLKMRNNKYIRFYDVADGNYGYVGMSTGNNMGVGSAFGHLQLAAGGTNKVQLIHNGAEQACIDTDSSFKVTGGTWNTSHLKLGAHHLWVDASGRLRMKSSAPTSDMDGTVVGAQA